MSHKAIKIEAFEEIHQVFLFGISYNMSSLVKYDNYGAIKTIDTSTMVYYVIKFASEVKYLQDDTTWYVKIISAGKLFVKTQ